MSTYKMNIILPEQLKNLKDIIWSFEKELVYSEWLTEIVDIEASLIENQRATNIEYFVIVSYTSLFKRGGEAKTLTLRLDYFNEILNGVDLDGKRKSFRFNIF